MIRPLNFARRTPLLPLAVLLLVGLAAAPARPGVLDAAGVESSLLPSGLQVVIRPSGAADLASVQLWVRAGGFLETPETNGVTHTIEHLLFRSSAEKGEASIDSQVENLGGLLEATTEKDWTRLTCTVSGRHAGRVVELIGQTMREPGFTDAALDSERPLLMEEIEASSSNPLSNSSALLYEMAFKKHPYRLDVRGNPAVIQRLKAAEVEAFYKKHYHPARMILVVAGNVDPAQIRQVAGRAFPKQAQAAQPLVLPEPELACREGGRKTIGSPFGGGFVGIAFAAPSVTDLPATHCMDVILTILEHGGQGRLPRLLRGAPVQAAYETRRQPGLLLVLAGAGGANPLEVEALLRKEIDFLRMRPVPADELELARRRLRGSFALDNETFTAQAGTLGYYAAIHDWKFASDYAAAIEAVTAEQIQETAQTYLDPDRSITLLLQPAAREGRPD